MAFIEARERPGGYDFLADDGSVVPAMASPYADQLAAQLRAAQGPDMRTAQAQIPSVDAMAQDAGPPPPAAMMSDAGPAMSVAPPAPPPPPAARAPQTAVQGPGMAQAAPADAGAGYAGPAEPAPARSDMVQAATDRMLTDALAPRMVYSPGRAAYDPEADAASRRGVPVSRTRAGGLELTDDEQTALMHERWKEGFAQERQQEEAFSRVAEAYRGERQAMQDAGRAEAEVLIERRKRANLDQRFREEQARLSAEVEAISNRKVDPNGAFHGSTFAQIASIIAQGMGAYGASLGGGPNFASQLIQSAIDRDIASQKDQIERGVNRASTALGRLEARYGMDRTEAAEALRTAQLAAAEARARQSAAAAAPGAARQNAALIEAEIAKQRQESTLRLAELTRGRVTTQEAMAAPRAGTRGGMRMETDAERTARLKGELGNIKEIKELLGSEGGTPAERSARLAERKENMERRVTLSDGSFAWATTKDRADEAIKAARSVATFKSNIRQMIEILEKSGSSMGDLAAKYEGFVASNLTEIKNFKKLGALTQADATISVPLSGEGGNEWNSIKSQTIAKLKVALQDADKVERDSMSDLFQDPDVSIPIQPAEGALGIKRQ